MSGLTEGLERAVEAGLWAWITSAAEGVTRENVNPRVLDLNRHRMVAALTAALPHLHPTIPNTREALESLPDGAVIWGRNPESRVYSGSAVAELQHDPWDPSTGEYGGWTPSEVLDCVAEWGITEWTVLWPIGGGSDA